MKKRDDYYTYTAIRRGDVEIACHMDENTGEYITDTVHIILYDNKDVAIEIGYEPDGVFELAERYRGNKIYGKDIQKAVTAATNIGWL